MREYRNDEITEFMEDLEREVEKSKEKEMICVLCFVPTMERVVGMEADAPARPFIFAVCERCKEDPEWAYEANQAVMSKLEFKRTIGGIE